MLFFVLEDVLLYDKEGKLMNIDATRPSNPQTKEMLEQLK